MGVRRLALQLLLGPLLPWLADDCMDRADCVPPGPGRGGDEEEDCARPRAELAACRLRLREEEGPTEAPPREDAAGSCAEDEASVAAGRRMPCKSRRGTAAAAAPAPTAPAGRAAAAEGGGRGGRPGAPPAPGGGVPTSSPPRPASDAAGSGVTAKVTPGRLRAVAGASGLGASGLSGLSFSTSSLASSC